MLETHKNRRCRPVGQTDGQSQNQQRQNRASDRNHAQNAAQNANDDSSEILRRVQDKLGIFNIDFFSKKYFLIFSDGKDFNTRRNMNVNDQVDMLIREAQNIENLCQHYTGWCSHF